MCFPLAAGLPIRKFTRDLNYTYDGADNVTARSDAVNGQTDSYSLYLDTCSG
jgi:YD repeat-containing protein